MNRKIEGMISPYIRKKPQEAFVNLTRVKERKCDNENETFLGREIIDETFKSNQMNKLTETIWKSRKKTNIL